MKVHLTLTQEQADALVRVCDLAYRVASGHWRDVAQYAGDHNRRAGPECAFYGSIGDALEKEARAAFDLLPGQFYGIGSPDLDHDLAGLARREGGR